MATIHYLNWDTHSETAAAERRLFQRLHVVGLSDRPQLTLPPDFYRTVATGVDGDPETIFAKWNRGSGCDTTQLNTTYLCHDCASSVGDAAAAQTHAQSVHAAEVDDFDDPEFIRPERSMSVGDIIESDTDRLVVVGLGFLPVTWGDPDSNLLAEEWSPNSSTDSSSAELERE